MNFILEPLDGPVTDTLDLHGFKRAEAEPAVVAFVNRNAKKHPGALLHVITGRGKGSPGMPALKPRVRTLLKSDTLPVAAWGPDLDDGGFLIRLKAR